MTTSLNRIAYINIAGQIETVGPTGQDRRLITQAADTFQFPAWAPDGTYLAAIGSNPVAAGVYLVQDSAAGSPLRELYRSATMQPFYLYWMPRSGGVSFLANHPRDGIGLHLASMGHETRLITTGQPLFWDWMPDTGQVVTHEGIQWLRLLAMDGTFIKSLSARPGFFQAPVVAGQQWAYAEFDTTQQSWIVITGPAQPTIRLPHEGAAAFGWNATGQILAFISPRQKVENFLGPLRLVQLDTGQVELLTEDTVLAFFWAPDGRHIAYFTLAGGETSMPMPFSTNGHGSSTTADDTLRLDVWVVAIDGTPPRHLLTFEPHPLFVSQFLPFFDQYALSHSLWSPHSDGLVIPAVVDTMAQITVISPTELHAPRVVGEGSMPCWSGI